MKDRNHSSIIRSLAVAIVGALGLFLALLGWFSGPPDIALANGSTELATSDSPGFAPSNSARDTLAPASVLCVDPSGAGGCYTTVQAAVDAAQPGDEIRVATGVYADLQGRPAPPGYTGPSTITQVVYLSKTLTLRGGYTTTDWSAPNPISYPTVLDAQAGGRVLFIAGDGVSVTIEGFHITGGRSQGLGGGVSGNQDAGSGVYGDTATVTLENNRVYANDFGWGAGLYLAHNDSLVSDNQVYDNTGTSGVGVYLYYSHASLDANRIWSNSAAFGGGGGVYLAYSSALFNRNIITGNLAFHPLYGRGAGIYLLHDISATLVNNLVADNQATRPNNTGSGILIEDSSARLLHNTITRNTGGDGSGIALASGSSAYLSNTILVDQAIGIRVANGNTAETEATLWGAGDWANDADWVNEGTLVTGTINLWDDPDFVAPEAGDYHIGADSAAVDAGLNLGVREDIDGDPRPVNPQYDIGADEYSPGCYARLNEQPFVYSTVQAAVDASTNPTDVIKVAGYCFGVEGRAEVTQTVYLSKTLTIQGGYDPTFAEPPDPVAHPTTLNARGEGRVFYIGGPSVSPTIAGLRLIQGSATGLGGGPNDVDAGGGVYATSATLTFQGNWVLESSAQAGGGLFLAGSDVTLIDDVIADNQAGDGGSGVYAWESTPRLAHNTLARNRDGAGLYASGGSTVALTNTILVSHAVGVYAEISSAVSLTATLWGAGAWANGADWSGPGTIYTGSHNYWGDPAFACIGGACDTPYHISARSAARDVGVASGLDIPQDIDGELRLMGQGYDLGADEHRTCWVRLNDDLDDYFTVQAAVDASSSPLDEVKVAGTCTDLSVRPRADVGATGLVTQVVYLSKTLTLRGGYTATDWLASNPEANPTTLDAQGNGRALYVSGQVNPTVEGLQITGGDATGLGGDLLSPDIDAGGGVYAITATLTLDQCQIRGNMAYLGGGAYLSSYGALLNNSEVLSNTAQGAGGGLYLAVCENVTLSGNTIEGNRADSGGGVYLWYCQAMLSDNVIRGNEASGGGGGIYLWNGSRDTLLRDNIVSDNTAAQWGGGIHLWDSREVTLEGNAILSNTAQEYGGGVWLNFSLAELSANTVHNNAALTGGGAYLRASVATLTNDVIAGNQASSEGSGLYLSGSEARLRHITIADNNGGDGSGIRAATYLGAPALYSDVWLTNTILADQAVGLWVAAGNTATLEASLWNNASDWGGDGAIYTGSHNYWGDPAFADPGAGDYHLSVASAAIDRAIASQVVADIDGELRPGVGDDLGADEYPYSLQVSKQAAPDPVQAGDSLTYTLRLTNTGAHSLTATVTDLLPAQVSPTGALTWTLPDFGAGDVWAERAVVAVEIGYAGPLVNVVQVTSQQGASGVYTTVSESQVTPALAVTKLVHPDPVQAGEQLTYTLRVTNVGNVDLQATVTDWLPAQVSPAGPLVWSALITAPHGVWTQQVLATVQTDYAGLLTNIVQVSTIEGATGVYTLTSRAQVGAPSWLIYLPVVLKANP